MTENTDTTNKRQIWVRGFFMLLMALAFHISVTVLFAVTLIQFVLALLNGSANNRLVDFGRNLAGYLQQIVHYLTFVNEVVPFPFSDWPSADQ